MSSYLTLPLRSLDQVRADILFRNNHRLLLKTGVDKGH